MLILSRKAGEELMIGDDILVRVVKTSGGRVTLAFDAPKSVSIKRSEIPCDVDLTSETPRRPR